MARAGDDVAFGLENRAVPTAEIWRRVDEALTAVGFPYGRDHPTAALSGGEQQRLALAGILALRPGLLLLDEVTANLDPGGAALVRTVLADVLSATGATAVIVEHRVEQIVDLVTRAVVLEPGGGVTEDGPPDEVFGRSGARLAARGVWVPGHRPDVRRGAVAAARTPPGACRGGDLPLPGCGRRRAASHRRDPARRRGPGADRSQRVRQVDARAVPGRAAPADRGRGARRAGAGPAGCRRGRCGAGRAATWSPGSGRCSRTRSTSSSTSTVRAELMVGPRRAGHGRDGGWSACRRAAGAARADGAGGSEPVHAVGRREASALGGDRHRDRARGGRRGRADVRAGRADLGGAGRAARRPARRRLRPGDGHARHRPGRRGGRRPPRARPDREGCR